MNKATSKNYQSASKKFKVKQDLDNILTKKKLIRKEFLRDQILNHDRLDLLMTELLGYEMKDFHAAMYYGVRHNSLIIENTKGKKQTWNLTLAPRGFGKSTSLTISRAILLFIKNPNIKILLVSKTEVNAMSFLAEIKNKIARPEFREIFGDLTGKPWNEGNIRIKTRKLDDREDTIETVGVGGSLASRHYDFVIADDLCDEENSRTEGQRIKMRTWFYKILDPCLMPYGEMSLIGTRYHPEDLYGHLMNTMLSKRNRKGKVIQKHYQIFPALIDIPGKIDNPKLPEHKKYYSLWPEAASVKYLLSKRKNMGSIIFNSQYQNDIDGMKGKIFKFDWFQWYKPEDINVDKLLTFSGVDLAIKQSEDADKFAHVTIGVDKKTQNVYVLNYHNAVTHYTDQKKIIVNEFDAYDPIRVGIEANGYQRSLLQDMQTDKDLTRVRTQAVFTDKDKTIRAWKLAAYFERQQIFFKIGMHEIMEQLLKMPDGRYKDLFDALDIAIGIAFGGARRQRETEPGLF